MKNLNFYSIAVLIVLLTFASCKKENNEVSKSGLVPLKSGNSWTYKVYRSDIVVDTIILKIGDYVTINGNTGFRYISGDNSFSETFLVDNDNDGNFLSVGGYSDKDSLFSESMRYKKDALKGDFWDSQEISYVDNTYFEKVDIQVYCISSDTTINTSKGDFQCKAYQSALNNGEDVFIEYISENVGIVKMEHFENSHLFSYQILLDYHVAK